MTGALKEETRTFENRKIKAAIRKSWGNLVQCARILGVRRTTLIAKIKRTPTLQEFLDQERARHAD